MKLNLRAIEQKNTTKAIIGAYTSKIPFGGENKTNNKERQRNEFSASLILNKYFLIKSSLQYLYCFRLFHVATYMKFLLLQSWPKMYIKKIWWLNAKNLAISANIRSTRRCIPGGFEETYSQKIYVGIRDKIEISNKPAYVLQILRLIHNGM